MPARQLYSPQLIYHTQQGRTYPPNSLVRGQSNKTLRLAFLCLRQRQRKPFRVAVL
ncbi:MAG: hypothetical protein KatS3mg023_1647 [Armatimonadota bacterium]|nr:MAG: hypothetical protein KatS3mg023_1647 [Armatimonadota bacterium]